MLKSHRQEVFYFETSSHRSSDYDCALFLKLFNKSSFLSVSTVYFLSSNMASVSQNPLAIINVFKTNKQTKRKTSVRN